MYALLLRRARYLSITVVHTCAHTHINNYICHTTAYRLTLHRRFTLQLTVNGSIKTHLNTHANMTVYIRKNTSRKQA